MQRVVVELKQQFAAAALQGDYSSPELAQVKLVVNKYHTTLKPLSPRRPNTFLADVLRRADEHRFISDLQLCTAVESARDLPRQPGGARP
jgi:hypothetical protein